MSLLTQLNTVKSEEDVKDAYIKALGLKSYSKGLIDIRTEEIWFEAKQMPTSSYEMFAQLLNYVHKAMKSGESIPPFLAVIDTVKAAIMKTEAAMPLLKRKDIPWGKSASRVSPALIDMVSNYIGTHFVSFRIDTHEEECLATFKQAIISGDIIRTPITPNNLKQIFDKWVTMIGQEIVGVKSEDYALLFFADIMHDGTSATHHHLPAQLLHKDGFAVFELSGKLYSLGNKEGYRQFWQIYDKPPKAEYRNYLLERRDSLIANDERSFKGAYYTPLHVVDKAYDLLTQILGKHWQKDYLIWDMCCGVGNLEVKHSNHRNIYMSTLDSADIDIMKAAKTCVAAERFQYDYLNDDIDEHGHIDYNLSNKLPNRLRQAIKEGKKILVLINPPYAEASNRGFLGEDVTGKKNKKTEVAKTKISNHMYKYGKASNELFVQFLARISIEVPTATIAMFSTMKYVNAQSLEKFRQHWHANYLGGFVVHNKAFDGMIGKFPIGFLIWQTNQNSSYKIPITKITVDVYDKDVIPIGEKTFYNLPSSSYLNVWFDRPKANNEIVLPIKNAISPATTKPRATNWSDNAIGYLHCGGNDVQQTEQLTTLYSCIFSNGNGIYINEKNLWQAAIVFSVRRLVNQTWLNDRDQFLQPTKELSPEFKLDCLIWMLFNRCNKTASADGLEWNDKTWSIVNHFIPFTEQQVGAEGRFESSFMVDYLNKHTEENRLSIEAHAVMNEGLILWQAYFSYTDVHSVRQELKLNRQDVGWYQVRNALKRRNDSGDVKPVHFANFELAYKTLTQKLQPLVFELGFLK